jgi:undecaprenyl-diphosphatase
VVLAPAAVTVILSDTLGADLLKPLFGRLRPCHPDALAAGARCLDGTKSSFSFPSAHAMNIFAQAILLARLYPAGGIFFYLFAALIGLSRIYIGVHYPLDVIGGAAAGSAIGAGIYAIYAQLSKRRLVVGPIQRRPPGPSEAEVVWLAGSLADGEAQSAVD